MHYAAFGRAGGAATKSSAADELREEGGQVLPLIKYINPERSTSKQLSGRRPSEADVRQVIRARRMRSRFFAAELFADPAWDILLDLYAAWLGQCRVSVSDACLAANVPPTTGLRWITTLEKAGLIVRSNDPLDRRRIFVELSEDAVASMDAYFGANPTA